MLHPAQLWFLIIINHWDNVCTGNLNTPTRALSWTLITSSLAGLSTQHTATFLQWSLCLVTWEWIRSSRDISPTGHLSMWWLTKTKSHTAPAAWSTLNSFCLVKSLILFWSQTHLVSLPKVCLVFYMWGSSFPSELASTLTCKAALWK